MPVWVGGGWGVGGGQLHGAEWVVGWPLQQYNGVWSAVAGPTRICTHSIQHAHQNMHQTS